MVSLDECGCHLGCHLALTERRKADGHLFPGKFLKSFPDIAPDPFVGNAAATF